MLNATLIRREVVTDELLILHVKPDAGVPQFAPGQYVALGLPGSAPRPEHFPPEKEPANPEKLIKRAYSIGSSPAVRDYLEFYVAIVPDGALTSRLVLLKEGDRLHAAPKITGTFTTADVPADENLVLMSTGTGIAPYMAMVRTPETWTGERKVTIVHGVRFSKDFAYREELKALAASNKNFQYLPIVSRADPEWNGERGHVQKLFERGVLQLDASKDHVYLCGNPAMIDDIEKDLTSKGYVTHSKRTPGKLHLEKYW